MFCNGHMYISYILGSLLSQLNLIIRSLCHEMSFKPQKKKKSKHSSTIDCVVDYPFGNFRPFGIFWGGTRINTKYKMRAKTYKWLNVDLCLC